MTDLPEWALPIRDMIANELSLHGEFGHKRSRDHDGRIEAATAVLAVALPVIGEWMACVAESIDTFDRDVKVSAAGAIAVVNAANAIRKEAGL